MVFAEKIKKEAMKIAKNHSKSRPVSFATVLSI
jgi:hypothetical protein